MTVVISRTAMTSCLGDAESTCAGLLAGASGERRLGGEPAGESTVSYGYPVGEQPRNSAWPLLAPVLASVCRGLPREDLEGVRVIVGTGMHEQRLTEVSAIGSGSSASPARRPACVTTASVLEPFAADCSRLHSSGTRAVRAAAQYWLLG